MKRTIAKLTLEDGSTFEGVSFGHETSIAGELVFTTGMTGYPEAMTDPSYRGQILTFTYPMIGNYGAPPKEHWESDHIHTTAIIVSNYIENNTHHQSHQTLADWLKAEQIPGIVIPDTRALTQKIREKGALLAKIEFNTDRLPFHDPNKDNLAAQTSVTKPVVYKPKSGTSRYAITLIDCGVKMNIVRSLVHRGCTVTVVPWDYDITTLNTPDGYLLSNGPGDPKMLDKTIASAQHIMKSNTPVLGICLGNQILALAAGGDTRKMKFGHRSQNQPCLCHDGSERYYLTTQNHGFEVSKIPSGFNTWFSNGNDGTNEGIIHQTKPWMSVQFHPEATPGPTDTTWVFDHFLKQI